MTLIEILKELENIFDCPVSKLGSVHAKHSKHRNGLTLKGNLVIITRPNGEIIVFNSNGYLYENGEFATKINNEELKKLNEPSCVGGVSRCFDPHPFGAKNPFDFELEMINIFGKEKAKKVIDEIAEFYKTSLPIQPVSISFFPFGFDEFGKSLTATSNCCHPYRYLVTLKRKRILKNDETFYYRFN